MPPKFIAEITPALPADAAVLALLLSHDPAACALRPPPPCGEGGGGGAAATPLAHLRRRIALGGVRIAKANGRAAGFIDRTGDEILSLYIAPTARRHGLARALVADAKEAAARLTAVCPTDDGPSRAFWAAQGFAPAKPAADHPDIRLIWNGAA